jgi:dienelactone hydrolase
MRLLALVGVVMTVATVARGEVRSKVVEYKQGDTTLEGFLAWDDAAAGKRPGVLVVHQWMGLTEYERMRAQQLAGLGYVAFAVDVYGKGVRPKSAGEAGPLAGKYKGNRALLRARAIAGLDVLRANGMVDPKRIAAIGYCFGGTTVLELARSGADVAGVVSFHGGLDAPGPTDGKGIKARVLVLHGADDPFNQAKDIAAFQQEMRSGGVDWQMVYYGGAVHSFTQKEAGDDPSKGAAYNATADRRSWQALKDFLGEIFR